MPTQRKTSARPVAVVEQTVIIELPADVARTLYEMFSYSGITEIYSQHVTKYNIKSDEITKATTQMREALGPPLETLKAIQKYAAEMTNPPGFIGLLSNGR